MFSLVSALISRRIYCPTGVFPGCLIAWIGKCGPLLSGGHYMKQALQCNSLPLLIFIRVEMDHFINIYVKDVARSPTFGPKIRVAEKEAQK